MRYLVDFYSRLQYPPGLPTLVVGAVMGLLYLVVKREGKYDQAPFHPGCRD